MAEKKQYRITKQCFRDGRIYDEGATIWYDGKPSDWMIPVEEQKASKSPGSEVNTNDMAE